VSIVAYAGLSYYSSSSDAHDLGAVLALAPATLVGLILAWRSAPPAVALLATVALAALLCHFWPLLKANFTLFYLVQESSIYGLLGLTFTRSLLPKQVALCTQLADKIHGPLSPREVWYTRRVTAAWAVFFFAVVAVSILLFLFAPMRIWAIFINFCTLPLVGGMFVAEYLVRRRALPQIKRAGLLATVRVYFTSPQ
jgi:uncharacterized membrane protein